MTVEIHEHPFDPWQAVSEYRSTRLASGKSGASAVFVGTMRDFNEGDEVQAMVLEHYPGMTEQQLEDMRSEAVSKHGWRTPCRPSCGICTPETISYWWPLFQLIAKKRLPLAGR